MNLLDIDWVPIVSNLGMLDRWAFAEVTEDHPGCRLHFPLDSLVRREWPCVGSAQRRPA